jgi:hypothetical protein
MASLREQLIDILPTILPKTPDEAILGSDLLEQVKKKLVGEYADSSIRQHVSVLAGDADSPIARLEEAYGYYLRPLWVPHPMGKNGEPSGKKSGKQRTGPEASDEEQVAEGGRDVQLEEKFRAVFVRYAGLSNQFPMIVDHTRAKRALVGANRWKFPDVIVLEWDVGEAKDAGFRLDPDLLEVKRSLGEQPFRLSSIELKVELSLADFRPAFFQCVSNSKWAHHAVLAVAVKIADKTLAEELRRLGSSYDVTVLTYGIAREALVALPSASSILKMDEAEFERSVASQIQHARVATGAPRATLDWEHISDMRSQSPEFGHLFEWVSSCLDAKTPYTFEDFERLKQTKQRYR